MLACLAPFGNRIFAKRTRLADPPMRLNPQVLEEVDRSTLPVSCRATDYAAAR